MGLDGNVSQHVVLDVQVMFGSRYLHDDELGGAIWIKVVILFAQMYRWAAKECFRRIRENRDAAVWMRHL